MLAVAPATAMAQWSVEASAGGSSYELVTATVTTASGVLAIRNAGSNWVQAALGFPLDSRGVGWAMGAAGGEIPLANTSFGLAGDIQGFGYGTEADRFAGWGGIADVGPFARGAAGPVRLEGRVGALAYRSGADGIDLSRTFGYGAIAADVDAGNVLRISTEMRYLRASEGGYPQFSAIAHGGGAAGGAWIGIGYWMSDAVDRPELSAGAYFSATDRLELTAAARQDTNDPIFWDQPRTSWSIGVSYALEGADPARDGLAVPVEVQSSASVIRLPVGEAAGVPLVAGDFNDWTPTPMALEGDAWVFRTRLEPGLYRYAFSTADGVWFLPDSVEQRVDDGFGGENGLLIVQ